MTRMDEHAEIRAQLAVLVAGALDADAEARIARHTATCPSCASEFERWQAITGGLLSLMDLQFREMWILFAIFTALTWLAGGSAAVLLSVRRRHERSLA